MPNDADSTSGPDTDGDGISDDKEGTTTDTDSDGVEDYLESNIADEDGITDHLDPFNDSDGDGLTNIQEIRDGTDPTDVQDFFYPKVYCNNSNTPTEVVEILNPTTGKIWMDRNLGATRVPVHIWTDDQGWGDLYQWGRDSDGHQCRTSPTTTVISSSIIPGHGDFIYTKDNGGDWLTTPNSNLWQGVDGKNNPCPKGFRIPTSVELDNERLSWAEIDNVWRTGNNDESAYRSPLKWSLSGFRDDDGRIFECYQCETNSSGEKGRVWASDAKHLLYKTEYAGVTYDYPYFSFVKSLGAAVRCIKD